MTIFLDMLCSVVTALAAAALAQLGVTLDSDHGRNEPPAVHRTAAAPSAQPVQTVSVPAPARRSTAS